MAIVIDPPYDWEFDGNRLGYIHKGTGNFLPDRLLRELGGWENIMTEKVKPEKVKRYVCLVCGELLVKIYPFAPFGMTEGTIFKCKKCIAKGK